MTSPLRPRLHGAAKDVLYLVALCALVYNMVDDSHFHQDLAKRVAQIEATRFTRADYLEAINALSDRIEALELACHGANDDVYLGSSK